MKTFFAIALVGCGVSNAPDEIETTQPVVPTHPLSAPNGKTPHAPTQVSGYRIEAIPSAIPGGRSYAGRAICNGGGVVGAADITGYNVSHAILYKDGQLTDLGTLGGTISRAADGNASGTIVGGSSNGNFGRPFVYRNGVMTELQGIGGQYGGAIAINDAGQIVGEVTIPGVGDVDNHAVLWDTTCQTPIDLTALNGGQYSFPRDINNRGEIVGVDIDVAANQGHAVVWRDRIQVELDDGGAPNSDASAINESGTIVGSIRGTGFAHAVAWQDDVMIDLGTLGGSYAQASGINNSGDIVGSSTDVYNNRGYAFLYSNGSMINLNALINDSRWWIGGATDVCDDGTIVGNGLFNGESTGFILTPEP